MAKWNEMQAVWWKLSVSIGIHGGDDIIPQSLIADDQGFVCTAIGFGGFLVFKGQADGFVLPALKKPELILGKESQTIIFVYCGEGLFTGALGFRNGFQKRNDGWKFRFRGIVAKLFYTVIFCEMGLLDLFGSKSCGPVGKAGISGAGEEEQCYS